MPNYEVFTKKFKHIINSLILDYYNPNFNGICYLVFYRKIYRCSNGHRLSIQVCLHLLHPFYFYYYRKVFSLEKLIRLVVYTTSLIGAINIFSMITQTGILSYSDKFGFGYSGYYADGNALGVYMVLAVLLCIWYSFYKRNVFYFLLTFIASVGTILIGSRVGIIGILADWGLFLGYFFFSKTALFGSDGKPGYL